jgi:hypothetical protein
LASLNWGLLVDQEIPMHSPYPALNDRARGWLRFLYEKAVTPDDWSSRGTPNDWWDKSSTAPMCAFPRFDLSESTYALTMMADQTPAWREVYSKITDELCQRHTTHWAAIDWLTQIGHDPDRENYPDGWYEALIPAHMRGKYDAPGWTANGIKPCGIEPDPIGSTGNLFFRGFFNLVLSTHKYISGDDRWEQPFNITGYQDQKFSWTHKKIAEYLSSQWAERPEGPHCENTKIWPYCLSAAGLGLLLFDGTTGKNTHDVFDSWQEYARDNYMSVNDKGELEWFTMYYDPVLDHHHTRGAASGLSVSLYMLPQNREFASFLYEAAVHTLGWNNPRMPIARLPDPRIALIGLIMAREMGDHTTASRLGAFAENNFEPRYFGDDDDRFGWWFGLDEDWPRGQLSSLMMMNEVGKAGSWSQPFTNPNLDKFNQPTVSGVDFPALGLDRAWNDLSSCALHVGTYAATTARHGEATSFTVENLPNSGEVVIICDGESFDGFTRTNANSIAINTDINTHQFQIYTGYHKGRGASSDADNKVAPNQPRSLLSARPNLITQAAIINSVNSGAISTACPCC